MKTGGRACITSGRLVGLLPAAVFFPRGARRRGALMLRLDSAEAGLRAFFFLTGEAGFLSYVCLVSLAKFMNFWSNLLDYFQWTADQRYLWKPGIHHWHGS